MSTIYFSLFLFIVALIAIAYVPEIGQDTIVPIDNWASKGLTYYSPTRQLHIEGLFEIEVVIINGTDTIHNCYVSEVAHITYKPLN